MNVFFAACFVVYFIGLTAFYWNIWRARRLDDHDGGDMNAPCVSPGLCCEVYLSAVQRRVIIRWIEDDVCSSQSLRSFAKQIRNTSQLRPIPLYWGQVMALLMFLDRHDMKALQHRICQRLLGGEQ